jgi:hypothetical protein
MVPPKAKSASWAAWTTSSHQFLGCLAVILNIQEDRQQPNCGYRLQDQRAQWSRHSLVTIPLLVTLGACSTLSSILPLPFCHDSCKSGSFNAFSRIGKPRTSNRLASHLTTSFEPNPMLDRVKAEPNVLPMPIARL